MNEFDYTIAKAILNDYCDGSFDIEVELDKNTVANVCGIIETENYQEDDYYNGTGAWVATYASVCISDLELISYDENGRKVPCCIEIHESEIEDYCRTQLLQN